MIVLHQKGERGRVDLVRFSPDGRSLLTPLRRGIRIWGSLPTPTPPRIIPDLVNDERFPYWNVSFTPDGKTILVNSKPLAICDLTTGTARQIKLWAKGLNDNCYFNLAPDGKHFVVTDSSYGSPSGWITCRPIQHPDAENAVWCRKLPRSIYHHPTFLSDEQFLVRETPPWLDPDYHRAVPRCVICSVRTGEVLSECDCSEFDLWHLNTSPNRELLAGLKSARIVLFSVRDFTKPLLVLRNNIRRDFTGIAFHPSGRYLAATSNDTTVKLYDTATWEVARTFTWDVGKMRSIAFSPDGTLAAAGSDSGKVIVWDVDL